MNSDHFIDLPEPAKPLWEAVQAEVELGVMAPPVGSIFGPQDYSRGLQVIINYLTDQWRMGHDTSGAVHLLKRQKMIADGSYQQLIG